MIVEPSSSLPEFRFSSSAVSQGQQGQSQVTLTDFQGRVMQKAVQVLGKAETEKPAEIHNDVVHLDIAAGESGDMIRVAIAIHDIAEFLGVSEASVKEAVASGEFEQRAMEARQNEVLKESGPVSESLVSEQLVSDFAACGIEKEYLPTEEKLQRMQNVYQEFIGQLEEMAAEDGTAFIERDEGIPYSFVYVGADPELGENDPKKGMYIVLEDAVIGQGTFNQAVMCLHADSGEVRVFRHGPSEGVSANEREINRLVSIEPDHLAGGTPVIFEGAEGESRTGIIMELFKHGELQDILEPPLQGEHLVSTMRDAASIVGSLHELGVAHIDLKAENFFVAENGGFKLGDFGFATPFGQEIGAPGTPGAIAPEVADAAIHEHPVMASPEIDVFSLGCMFGRMVNKEWAEEMRDKQVDAGSLHKAVGELTETIEGLEEEVFFTNDAELQVELDQKKQELEALKEQEEKAWLTTTDKETFEKMVQDAFPRYEQPGTLDNIVYNCMRHDPNERMKLHDIVQQLGEIHGQLQSKALGEQG